MNIEKAGETGGIRKAEGLAGMDRVVAHSLHANMQFPQSGLGTLAYTLRAILTDPKPKERLREYFDTELSEKHAAEVLDVALKAHAAMLPADQQPPIDTAAIRTVWRDGKAGMAGLLYTALLTKEGDAPEIDAIDELQATALRKKITAWGTSFAPVLSIMERVIAVLAEPETKRMLSEYRRAFKKGGWTDNPDASSFHNAIMQRVNEALEEATRSGSGAERRAAERVLAYSELLIAHLRADPSVEPAPLTRAA